jgi:hypothetical protein|nr:MAG TPA: hypothetical protein [Caudoviricetes sp.]
MSKNLIPEIAQMLGVELGEEFKININNEIYQIDKNGMYRKKMNDEGQFDMWEEVPRCFIKLLAGNAKLIKLPWKPKIYDIYWTFKAAHIDVWCITDTHWLNNPNDVAAFKNGWVFRSKEGAEAALPVVAAEFDVKYKL